MVGLKKQFLAFLRDAVLHKFYCKFEKVTCKHSKVKSEVSLTNGIVFIEQSIRHIKDLI